MKNPAAGRERAEGNNRLPIHRFALAVIFRTRNDESDEDMMLKRKLVLLVLGCLALVLMAGYVTLWLTASRHRITQENLNKIQKGMTEKQVEAMLGARPGDYSSGQTVVFFAEAKDPGIINLFEPADLVKERGGKCWVADDAALWLRFDDGGHVTEVDFGMTWPGNESFLAKLRRWLGM
jgi:hypothetical protein